MSLAKAASIYGLTWGPDDAIVFSDPSFGGLQKVSAAGGKTEFITTLDSGKGEIGHQWPVYLPGGKALLFAVLKGGRPDDAQIVVERLDTRQRKVLVEGGTYPSYVSGHLVFVRGGTLMGVPLNVDRLEITGTPVAVAENVLESGQGAAEFSLSKQGSLVYVPGGTERDKVTVIWVDRQGTIQSLPNFPPDIYLWPDISPDGQRVVISNGGPASGDLWIYDIPRATLTRLTFDRKSNSAIWSPDGKWIAYSSTGGGGATNLLRRLADGSASEEQLTRSKNAQTPSSWSRDGNFIAFTEANPLTGYDIWVLPLTGDRKAQPFLQSAFQEIMPTFSPDGRWIAYVSDESGREEIYARPFPGPGQKWQISTEGGSQPLWAPNGELFYRSGDKMMFVEIKTEPAFSAGSPHMLFEGQYFWFRQSKNYAVTPDGQRFLMLKYQQSPPTQVNVVLNWYEELKQRLQGH